MWSDFNACRLAAEKYALERAHNPSTYPPIEIVKIEISMQPSDVCEVGPNRLVLEEDRLYRHWGVGIANAFASLDIPEEDAESFVYVIKRSGKTKKVIDENMSDVVTSGPFTFIKHDRDMVHAKLLLGSNLAGEWKIR